MRAVSIGNNPTAGAFALAVAPVGPDVIVSILVGKDAFQGEDSQEIGVLFHGDRLSVLIFGNFPLIHERFINAIERTA